MRKLWVLMHRWLGLATCLFLFVAGLTGAVIAWDHEIDGLLNPLFYQAPGQGMPLSSFQLVKQIEQHYPAIRVSYFPYTSVSGKAFNIAVQPRIDPATRRPYSVSYNQMAIDPVTGHVQAVRFWGKFSVSTENLIPFLYKLHYSLHIPAWKGKEIGMWLMGGMAILWFFDSFIALYLAFPNLKAWKKSFVFRWKQGGYKLVFDLHRSGGVWLWGLLLIFSMTSISMNLKQEVVKPLLSTVSVLSPDPFDPAFVKLTRLQGVPLSLEQLRVRASEEANRYQLRQPIGAISIMPELGLYGVGFYKPQNEHAEFSLGQPWFYFDMATGGVVTTSLPGQGSMGDLFLQSMFPIHSGRIVGLTGRITVTLLGIAVAVFSVTGFYIWLKKRRAGYILGRNFSKTTDFKKEKTQVGLQ